MRKYKIWKVILFSIGAISMIFVGVMIYAMSTFSESFQSPFDKLNQSDYKNFQEIGNEIFVLYDDGYLKVGESVGTAENDSEKPKVKTILSKYNIINSIYLVDKDVILISFGARFQSVDGIAIRRNNAELKNTYEGTGYDKGTLHYNELISNVFHYNAGL